MKLEDRVKEVFKFKTHYLLMRNLTEPFIFKTKDKSYKNNSSLFKIGVYMRPIKKVGDYYHLLVTVNKSYVDLIYSHFINEKGTK